MKRFFVTLLVLCSFAAAAETFDSWIEEPLLFGLSASNQKVVVAGSALKNIDRDTVNVRQGDFSMVFTADKDGKFKVGLTPGKFIDSWNLGQDAVLNMSVMTSMDSKSLPLELADAAGNIAKSVVDVPAGEWVDIDIPISKFDGIDKIDTDSVKAVQFVVEIKKGDKIWFDGVRFITNDGEVGVTDKAIDQRIEEAIVTKDIRRNAAFAEVAKTGGFKILLNARFAKLWLGQDVDQVNVELLEIFTTKDKEIRDQYGIDDHWALFLTSMLNRLYFNFSSKSKVFPGRLYPETEKALLELMWERTKDKNDIYLSKRNTWWMEGSENHDLNAKVADLLSSQIFMNEPDFKDRIYPDHGNGGGEGYWFHQMYSDSGSFGPHGRAGLRGKDEKRYDAEDHYKAWVKYLDEYLTERAKKGFFLEVGAPGYMKYTISFVNDIYDYCDNKQLREKAGEFLDLFWTDWSLEQINGVHGGGRTRDHQGIGGKDALYDYCQFLIGGPGNATHAHFAVLLTDYELPKVTLEFALGRKQLGSYEYITRKPGEANNQWPAPLGTERVIRCDTESRLLHYSWVTPDYIIGTQMDHPGAVHCHLSAANRTQGIIFSTSPDARIYPRDMTQHEDGTWKIGKEAFYRSVQHKNVLITQQAKEWFARHPDWFPSPPKPVNLPFGVYVSKSIEKKGEKDGWIFMQEGNSFVAINVIHCPGTGGKSVDKWDQVYSSGDEMAEPREIIGYEWVSDELIKCKGSYDTIIMETSSVSEHCTIQAFMDDVLDNSLRVEKTVVPGYYVVYYTGCGDSPEIYFNAAASEIPMIGGKRVDYSPKNVISSKYMNAAYGSGKIYIDRFGDKMKLKF